MSFRSEQTNPIFGLCAIVVVLVLAFMFTGWVGEHQKTQIQDWAHQNNFSVVSVEKCWFDHGPFWLVDEDDDIYYVVLEDRLEKKRISYFLFHTFGMKQAWKDN